MKIKLFLFLILLLTAGVMALAQNTQINQKPFQFTEYNDDKLSLINQIANPAGYERFATQRLTLYQHWLSNLPLKPRGTQVLNWKGKKISKADTLNRVIDMNIDSKYMTDADIPMLLLLYFFRFQGTVDSFDIVLSKTMKVNYKEWLRGTYIDEKNRNLYFQNEGLSRVDTDDEFQGFLKFVSKHFDAKALRLNIGHTDSRALEPSHMIVQFKEDDPDSVGHISIILDVALADGKPRKLLVAHGGNPARSLIVPNAGRTIAGRWFTIDEYREYLEEFGLGYTYRWKN